MNVDVETLLTIAGAVITVAGGGAFALARFAITAKEKELEHRLESLTRDVASAVALVREEQAGKEKELERFHEREHRVTRLEGDLALVRQAAGTLGEDVREIKDSMVPRHEWEANAERVDRQLESILVELRRSPRYPSSSHMGAAPSVPPRPAKKVEE